MYPLSQLLCFENKNDLQDLSPNNKIDYRRLKQVLTAD